MATQRETTVRYRTQLFHEARSIVAQGYASETALDDVVRTLSTSRRQVQRAFAEVGGTTFRAYLTSVRMRRAAELLASSDLRIRDVAAAVGYRQPAQFAKTFRRHHGATPSEYRASRAATGPPDA